MVIVSTLLQEILEFIEEFKDLEQLTLTGEYPSLEGKSLRLRVVDVAPQGTVGLHLHKGRPGFAYILSGIFTEYRNDQEAKREHKTGSLVVERDGVQHWWKNESKANASVLVIDIITSAP